MEVGGYIYIRSWVRGGTLEPLIISRAPLCEAMRREETSSRVKNSGPQGDSGNQLYYLAGYRMGLQDMDMTRQGTV